MRPVDRLIVVITDKHKYLLHIMLSGIKTGKKKKRKTANDGAAAVASLPDITSAPSLPKKPRAEASTDGNLSAAQLLKRQLKSGGIPSTKQKGGLEARLGRVTESPESKSDNVVVLTGAAAATTSDRPDYRPGMLGLLKLITVVTLLTLSLFLTYRGLSSRFEKGQDETSTSSRCCRDNKRRSFSKHSRNDSRRA